MDDGYVYILINESFVDLIKIGCTSFTSQDRAKQLSKATGVPTPFKVAFEIFVSNCHELEKEVHLRHSDYRINPNREFFRYPLHKAIDLIFGLKNSNDISNISKSKYQAIDITHQMYERYPIGIAPQISAFRILQTNERVYFEVTTDVYIGDYLKDQIIKRTDLGFIDGDYDDLMFKPEYTCAQNAMEFLKFDDIGMINCFDFFTKEKADELWEQNCTKR